MNGNLELVEYAGFNVKSGLSANVKVYKCSRIIYFSIMNATFTSEGSGFSLIINMPPTVYDVVTTPCGDEPSYTALVNKNHMYISAGSGTAVFYIGTNTKSLRQHYVGTYFTSM